MASHSKPTLFRLRALLLSLGLLFGGAAVHAQQAAVAPPAGDSKVGTDADFIAAADEVVGQMSQITGLKLLTPLKKSLRSREEIRAYVIKQMNEEKNPAERYADERSAEAFGLLPKGFDLDTFMVNVLTEQVEGLYDPKNREFYIADWSPLADQRMVMAHELTHALQDQHFQIEAWVRAARPNEDAELARDAVLEGSAMAAMVDYLMLGTGRSLKDLPDFDPGMLIGDLGSTPTLKDAPPFLKDALIFPYIGGLNFSAAVMRNSGWSALSGVFQKPPVSTQQILHPALYRTGKTPANVALPRLEKLLGDNWSKLDENIMGEFGWKEVFKQFLDADRAKTLAAAWDGDRYLVFEHKQTKKLILLTRLHLDSEVHAARFFGQYSEALEKKYSERSNLLRRPNFFSFDTPDGGVFLDCLGEECVTMEGATRQIFDGFTKALAWPMAPQPPEKPGPVPAKTAMIFAPLEERSEGLFTKRETSSASLTHSLGETQRQRFHCFAVRLASLLKAGKAMQEFLFQARASRREIWITRTTRRRAALAPESRQRQLREFRRAGKVFGVSLVMDGQLFAGVHAILLIAHDFLPDFRGTRLFAAALGHQCEVTASLGKEFGRQSRIQSLRTRGMRALGVATALQKS